MDVKLPKLGEGADSGVVVSLLAKEGDQVKEGQTLLELENEKAVAPIPSPVSGVVTKIRVREGDKISVGQVIVSIDVGAAGAEARPPIAKARGETPRPDKPMPVEVEPQGQLEPEDGMDGGADIEGAASPSIRKLAGELGIDLKRVRGSERGGRIVMADLRAYIQRLQLRAAQPPGDAGRPAIKAEQAPATDFSKWGPVIRKPVSQTRKVIGQRMSRSWDTVPRVTQFDEADITALMELRKKHQAAYEAKGARLTLTPLVVRAVTATLKKHPIFNASLDEAAGEIAMKEYYHIGLAVDTDAGLLVPVIRDADQKSLLQLATEIEALAGKARERRLSLEDMQGGTFTISNQGGIGGGHFTPIVNLPEVAILGLGRGAIKAVVKDKQIVPRLMLPIALSYDHRVIDGGVAARFVVDLVAALENPGGEEIRL